MSPLGIYGTPLLLYAGNDYVQKKRKHYSCLFAWNCGLNRSANAFRHAQSATLQSRDFNNLRVGRALNILYSRSYYRKKKTDKVTLLNFFNAKYIYSEAKAECTCEIVKKNNCEVCCKFDVFSGRYSL